jgi:hypothetical protein
MARSFGRKLSRLICLISRRQAGLPADLAEARNAPRDVSICGHVIANDEVLIVRDLARDPRFANNPWLKEQGLRFYAGVPLRGPNRFPVGALSILDTKPRDMVAAGTRSAQDDRRRRDGANKASSCYSHAGRSGKRKEIDARRGGVCDERYAPQHRKFRRRPTPGMFPHGTPYSILIHLPPLATAAFKPER